MMQKRLHVTDSQGNSRTYPMPSRGTSTAYKPEREMKVVYQLPRTVSINGQSQKRLLKDLVHTTAPNRAARRRMAATGQLETHRFADNLTLFEAPQWRKQHAA